jgi:RNA polymerase sigma-70 factor (ECF subfamily)
MKEKLRFAIERLHPQHREVIYLRYYEELDYDKISEILGIPIGTVKSRIARAKEEIMKNIGEL